MVKCKRKIKRIGFIFLMQIMLLGIFTCNGKLPVVVQAAQTATLTESAKEELSKRVKNIESSYFYVGDLELSMDLLSEVATYVEGLSGEPGYYWMDGFAGYAKKLRWN